MEVRFLHAAPTKTIINTQMYEENSITFGNDGVRHRVGTACYGGQ